MNKPWLSLGVWPQIQTLYFSMYIASLLSAWTGTSSCQHVKCLMNKQPQVESWAANGKQNRTCSKRKCDLSHFLFFSSEVKTFCSKFRIIHCMTNPFWWMEISHLICIYLWHRSLLHNAELVFPLTERLEHLNWRPEFKFTWNQWTNLILNWMLSTICNPLVLMQHPVNLTHTIGCCTYFIVKVTLKCRSLI